MDIPRQMWIPLGVVTAALIAGFISLINLLIAKDQKITEFRQAWIDSLRKEVATLVSLASAVSSLRHVVDAKQNHPATRDEALNDMLSFLKEENVKHLECRSRILLLLNPEDDHLLVSKLNELYEISKISSREEHGNVIRKCDDVVGETQRLLKKEWKRVKRGEPFYRAMKIIVMVAVLMLAIMAAVMGTRAYWQGPAGHQ